MDTIFSSWTTHYRISRRLALAPGQPLIQRVCNDCARAFVDECSTGERYAVHVSIFKVHRLSDEVTSRWLGLPSSAWSNTSPRTRRIDGPATSRRQRTTR
jgi:hypothetical protein